jgi:hypothetical protein
MSFNDDFPVPLTTYTRKLVGTNDEVWSRFLALSHGNERHTEAGWHKLLVAYRDGDGLPPSSAPSGSGRTAKAGK